MTHFAKWCHKIRRKWNSANECCLITKCLPRNLRYKRVRRFYNSSYGAKTKSVSYCKGLCCSAWGVPQLPRAKYSSVLISRLSTRGRSCCKCGAHQRHAGSVWGHRKLSFRLRSFQWNAKPVKQDCLLKKKRRRLISALSSHLLQWIGA